MTTRTIILVLVATATAVLVLECAWAVSIAQSLAPAAVYACEFVPNPEAGQYRDVDGAFIEQGERYSIISASASPAAICPFVGGDVEVVKNWRDAQQMALSAFLQHRQRVALIVLPAPLN